MKLSLALVLGAFSSFASAQDGLVDIPSTAIAAGIFETLVTALGAADLVGTLSDPNGPFTVFAPTDEAFGLLPGELITCVLEPENVDVLTSLLTYHVVEGAVFSGDLEDGMMPATLNSETIAIDLSDGVTINGASTVTTADVEATNGVIHIIDNVLVPPSFDVTAFLAACAASEVPEEPATPMEPEETAAELSNIPTTAVDAGIFETLVAALGAADLVNTLAGEGPFTVFAPSDEAFADLPTGLVPCLLLDENNGALTSILTYHVVAGAVYAADLECGMTPETLNGEPIAIDLTDGVVINEVSTVVQADVMATNGVIHVIDSVLVPPSIDVIAFLETCPSAMTSSTGETEAATDSASSASTVATVLAATLFAVLGL